MTSTSWNRSIRGGGTLSSMCIHCSALLPVHSSFVWLQCQNQIPKPTLALVRNSQFKRVPLPQLYTLCGGDLGLLSWPRPLHSLYLAWRGRCLAGRGEMEWLFLVVSLSLAAMEGLQLLRERERETVFSNAELYYSKLSWASTDHITMDTDIPYRLGGLAFAVIQILGIVTITFQIAWKIFVVLIPVTAICLWYQVIWMKSEDIYVFMDIHRWCGCDFTSIFDYYTLGKRLVNAASQHNF